jgi:hypothetical protein
VRFSAVLETPLWLLVLGFLIVTAAVVVTALGVL